MVIGLVERGILGSLPEEIDPLVQKSMNQAVGCTRTIRYTIDPRSDRYQEPYDEISAAEAKDVNGWKGLAFNFFALMADSPAFRVPLASIARTKASFPPHSKVQPEMIQNK